MVELKQNMDQHSLEIVRIQPDGNRKHVGYIQWHPERQPHIVISEAFGSLTLSELDYVLDRYRAHRERLSEIATKAKGADAHA